MVFDIMRHHLPEEVPQRSSGWRPADHKGSLLLFFPKEVREGVKVADRQADAVFCDRIVNLDTGSIIQDALVFGVALTVNIKGGIPDGAVLGRLGQGVPRGGNNPPWLLLKHSDEELQKADQWIQINASADHKESQ